MITKLKKYWVLIKSLQTGLLLITGLAGYLSTQCPVLNINQLLFLSGSLFLAISGSTVLNMWYDRDIDSIMDRTCRRPIPTNEVSPGEALILGMVLSLAGIIWAFLIYPLYGAVVMAGLTIAQVYGFGFNRKVIVLSSFLSAAALTVSSVEIGITIGFMRLIAFLVCGLLIIAMAALFKPSDKINSVLFKYASVFMLSTMLIFCIEGF